MFRFTQEPSSGSQSQCLAKITGMVPMCMSIRALPVLWRHIPTCCVFMCVFVCVCGSPCKKLPSCTVNYTHAQQVGICRHKTDNAHIDKHSETVPVILARH